MAVTVWQGEAGQVHVETQYLLGFLPYPERFYLNSLRSPRRRIARHIVTVAYKLGIIRVRHETLTISPDSKGTHSNLRSWAKKHVTLP